MRHVGGPKEVIKQVLNSVNKVLNSVKQVLNSVLNSVKLVIFRTKPSQTAV